MESSRKEIAKAERAQLRESKKKKKEDLEAFMQKQNDEIDADSVRCTLGPKLLLGRRKLLGSQCNAQLSSPAQPSLRHPVPPPYRTGKTRLSMHILLAGAIICDLLLTENHIFVTLQKNKAKGRLSFLLQQTEIFAHFAKDHTAQKAAGKGKGKGK